MPCIKKLLRATKDDIVELMRKVNIKADGDLNYILFKYCKYYITPSYNNYKNFKAELRECADIIHTEILVPYEMKKKEENGDV